MNYSEYADEKLVSLLNKIIDASKHEQDMTWIDFRPLEVGDSRRTVDSRASTEGRRIRTVIHPSSKNQSDFFAGFLHNCHPATHR